MLSRDEGSKFLHRLCRHYFYCEAVPVRNSCDEEAVSVCVCFCTVQREAAAAVSGEPPDDVAGGEVRSTTGGLNLPLVPHMCQKGFCWNGWDETCGNFVEAAQAVKPPGLKGLTKLGTGVGCMLESPYLSVCPSVCISEFVQDVNHSTLCNQTVCVCVCLCVCVRACVRACVCVCVCVCVRA